MSATIVLIVILVIVIGLVGFGVSAFNALRQLT